MASKIVELSLVHLKRIPRDRGVLFATLLFPLVFVGVFGFAFSQGGVAENQTIDLAIIPADNGIPEDIVAYGFNGSIVEGTYYQQQYLDILESVKYDDNETYIFDIQYFKSSEKDQALKLVQQGDIGAIVTIPQNFSLGVLAAFRSTFGSNMSIATNNYANYPDSSFTTDIEIQGDQTIQQFGIATTVLEQITDQFFNFDQLPSGYTFDINGRVDSRNLTIFDYILPGLVVFGIMQNLGVVSQAAIRDVEDKMLHRLKISNITDFEYTTSIIMSNLIISLVQIPILFGAGIIFGFPFSLSIGFAFVIAILLSLSMTGIGLIIAGLVTSTDAAGPLAGMIATPMAFLAGAFFETPNPTIIPKGSIFGSNEFGIMDLLPPTPAIESLRLVLIGGRGINDIMFQLLLLTILSLLFLITGVIIYSINHLRPE